MCAYRSADKFDTLRAFRGIYGYLKLTQEFNCFSSESTFNRTLILSKENCQILHRGSVGSSFSTVNKFKSEKGWAMEGEEKNTFIHSVRLVEYHHV